eukprot:jgi/Undpi1/6055/HiC_scaffold_20.g08540.m1
MKDTSVNTASGSMGRRLFFLAVALAIPAASAQAGPHALYADTVSLEHHQIAVDKELGAVRKTRRTTPTVEGSAIAMASSEPASDDAESSHVLQGAEIARTRDYLNALVDASVSSGDQQLSNLAFVKTHKTGSTTLSSLFYRYGVRHDLKILEECDGRVDIMHYHIGTSFHLGYKWNAAAEQYKAIMRDPDNINFVTILREPRSHFLSYYYYFISRRVGNISVEEFLLDPAHGGGKLWGTAHNSVAGELGIGSQQELEDFVMDALPKFKLVLLTDRFDEGLMLMRNLFGWDMIDLSYAILNQTSTTTMGGKKLGAQEHRPTFDELSIEAQTKIDELTSRDRAIYEAGRAHFEQNLAPLASQVEADVAGFNSLQKIIHEYLEFNRSSPARNM